MVKYICVRGETMNNRIELLAPAGNKENFIGAINAGANAIYLAGKSFGARAYASNFTNEELSELFIYAHLRNVKVFVTVNTIIYENEVNDLLKYTDFLVQNNVDALIVQDLGIIELLVNRYPDTEIHASTQMNVYNVHQATYLKTLGVSRIILARETSLDVIKEIKEKVDIDLEVFIHGALCVSYSGNCLFSSLNGGRSGNRGECAQPCRLPYKLVKENTEVSEEAYLMSTKDLLSINNLEEIISSGVASLKIEGRMRSFEYVTETVRTYNNTINDYYSNVITERDNSIKGLKTVFNREYTKGYISDELPYDINNSFRPNHQGVEVGTVINFNRGKTTIQLTDTLSKNDGIRILGEKDVGGKVSKIMLNNEVVPTAHKGDTIIIDMLGAIEKGSIVRKTLDTHLNKNLEVLKDTNFKLVPISMEIECFVGNKLSLSIQTPYTEKLTTYSDYTIEQAKNKPQTKTQIIDQFSKLGNTFYLLDIIKVNTDESGFIPNSVMNTLRRDTISELENNLLNNKKSIIKSYTKPSLNETDYELELIVKVENKEQYILTKELGINTIYYKENIDNNYVFMHRINDTIPKETNLVVQDFGLLNKDKNIITNEHLNVVNSYSVESLLSKGVRYITLSEESSKENTKDLIKSFTRRHTFVPPIELIVYNTPDLMISKYCPITKSLDINRLDCGICENNQYFLKDQKDFKYPLIRDSKCNIRVLHKKTVNNINKLLYYKSIGIKRFRVEFTTESKEEIRSVINRFKSMMNSLQ